MFEFINDLSLNSLLGKKYDFLMLDTPQHFGVIIKNMIDKYSQNNDIKNLASQITASCFDDYCKAEHIFNWVKEHTTFQDDPFLYERLITPDLAVKVINQYGQIYEDCDSITALLGSLIKSQGIKVKVIMSQTDNNNDLSHIYIAALLNVNGQEYYLPLDATYKNNRIGWEYPSANKIEI